MKANWDEKIDYGNPDAVKKHFLDFLAASLITLSARLTLRDSGRATTMFTQA